MAGYRFHLPCEARTPLHPGSGRGGPGTDAELCTLADGTPAVRGTSLGGALRSVVERFVRQEQSSVCKRHDPDWPPPGTEASCGCPTCRLFGDAGNHPEAAPSRLVVLDAPIVDPRTRIVDGIARSHATRAVAGQHKFDRREILPGARLALQVEVEDPTNDELCWLGAALSHVARGKVPLGGGSAAGLGWLQSEPGRWSLRRRDLSQPEHLLATLLHETGAPEAYPETVEPFPGGGLALPEYLEMNFQLCIREESSLAVSDPVEALKGGRDRAQRMLDGFPELPMSSLRGALRTTAALLVRTIKEEDGAACDPSGDGRCRDSGGLCPVCRVFGVQDWGSRLRGTVEPDPKTAQPDPETAQPYGIVFDHVPLDRFTQAPANKFDEFAVRGQGFQVRLIADQGPEQPTRPANGVKWWVLGLLAHAVNDLADGRVAVGGGAARGHGLFAVSKPAFCDSLGSKVEPDLEGCVKALWERLDVKFPERGGET